jgi:hypothetical protein
MQEPRASTAVTTGTAVASAVVSLLLLLLLNGGHARVRHHLGLQPQKWQADPSAGATVAAAAAGYAIHYMRK